MNISKNKAFTLIELLVTVAIIAILTAIVMANFGQAKAKARDGKRISDLAQIQLALEGFFDRCGHYPSDLTTINDGSTGGFAKCPANISLGTFISIIPTDPTNSSPYTYTYAINSTASDYVLKATLELSNNALVDSDKTNHNINQNNQISMDCTTQLAYCVQPR